MTDRYENPEHKKHSFFSNREIWEQVFGPDGRGGAIGELHNKVDTSFNGLETMVCEEFKNLGKKLDEYNGLREDLYEVNEVIDDVNGKLEHVNGKMGNVEKTLEQEEFKKATTNVSFQTGKKEAFREVKQFVAIVAVAFTALAALVAMLGLFVF